MSTLETTSNLIQLDHPAAVDQPSTSNPDSNRNPDNADVDILNASLLDVDAADLESTLTAATVLKEQQAKTPSRPASIEPEEPQANAVNCNTEDLNRAGAEKVGEEQLEHLAVHAYTLIRLSDPSATTGTFSGTDNPNMLSFDPLPPTFLPRDMVSEVGCVVKKKRGTSHPPLSTVSASGRGRLRSGRAYQSQNFQSTDKLDDIRERNITTTDRIKEWILERDTTKSTPPERYADLPNLPDDATAESIRRSSVAMDTTKTPSETGDSQHSRVSRPSRRRRPQRSLCGSSISGSVRSLLTTSSNIRRENKEILDQQRQLGERLGEATATVNMAERNTEYAVAKARSESQVELYKKDAEVALTKKDAEVALTKKDVELTKKDAEAAVREAKTLAVLQKTEQIRKLGEVEQQLAIAKEKAASLEIQMKQADEIAKLRMESALKAKPVDGTAIDQRVYEKEQALIKVQADYQRLELSAEKETLALKYQVLQKQHAIAELELVARSQKRDDALVQTRKERDYFKQQLASASQWCLKSHDRMKERMSFVEDDLCRAWSDQDRQRSHSAPRPSGETQVKTMDGRVPPDHRFSKAELARPLPSRPVAALPPPAKALTPVKEARQEVAPAEPQSPHSGKSKASSVLVAGDDASTYHASRQGSEIKIIEDPDVVRMPSAMFSNLLQALQAPKSPKTSKKKPLPTTPKEPEVALSDTSPCQLAVSSSGGASVNQVPGRSSTGTPMPEAPADPLASLMARELTELKETVGQLREEIKAQSSRPSFESSPTKPPPAVGKSTVDDAIPVRQQLEKSDAQLILEQVAAIQKSIANKGGSPANLGPCPSSLVMDLSYQEEVVPQKPKPSVTACAVEPPSRGIVVNAHSVNPNQIPEWSGSVTDIPFREWIRKFERMMSLSAATNTEEAKATYFPLRLTGAASIAFEAEPPEAKRTYHDMKMAIKDRFSKCNDEECPEWQRYEQRRHESVQDFALRLQQSHMDDLGDEAYTDNNQRSLRRVFISGLRKDIRFKLMDNLPEKWRPLLKRARIIEDLIAGNTEPARAASVGAVPREPLYVDEECSAVSMYDGRDDMKIAAAGYAESRRASPAREAHETTTFVNSLREDKERMLDSKKPRDDYHRGRDFSRGRGSASYRGRGRGGGSDRSRSYHYSDSSDWRKRDWSTTEGRLADPLIQPPDDPSDVGPDGKPAFCTYCKTKGHSKHRCVRWQKLAENYEEYQARLRSQRMEEHKAKFSGGRGKPHRAFAVAETPVKALMYETEEFRQPVREISGIPRLPRKYRRGMWYQPSLGTIDEDKILEDEAEQECRKDGEGNDTVASVHTKIATSRMYVDLEVNGRSVMALVDTGASISIISEKAAKTCISQKDIAAADRECQSATDHTIPMVGRATVILKVGSKTYEHPVYIAKDFSHDLLLGDDWMIRAECSLVYRGNKRTMILDGQQVKTRTGVISGDVQAAYQIALIDRYQVPGRTLSALSFKVPPADSKEVMQMKEGELVYVSPLPRGGFDSDVAMPKCITRVQDGLITVPVMNISPTKTSVPAGAYVVQIEPFEPDILSIQEIDMPDPKSVDEKKHAVCLEALKAKIKQWIDAGVPPPEIAGISFKDSDLTKEQKDLFAFALSTVREAFAEDDLELGMTKDVEHHIETGSTPPIRQHPYRVPFQFRAEMETMLKEMLQQGVIEPSNSPWSSPVVLVKKKDGKLRFCVDFRKVNAATRKDSYPLPRIDELLDSLNLAKFFTCIDLQSGFWQIPMTKEARSKTAFTCHMGLFEFTKMPFGLTSAPATFQRLMDCVLSGLTGLVCLVFLDDVIIFTKTTVEQHMYDLLRVLRTLMLAGLKVKGRKCKIARKQLQFLGHIVSAEGISPDPEKVKAIVDCVPPKNIHEVRVFLGLVGFYRKFIEGCAKLCACITKLLQKGVPFQWTVRCQIAFDCLKKLLSTAPILAYPDLSKPFVLYTDASGVGLGSVLAQLGDDGKEHVISFASRTLRGYEVKYGITELEMLAIVWSMGHYRPYLLGTETKIVTDHKANHWILEKKKPKSAVSMRLTRWAILLQEYDYVVEYRPGRKLRNADALSRPPVIQHSKDLKDFDFDPETWNEREEDEGTAELGLKVTRREPNPLLDAALSAAKDVTAVLPASDKVAGIEVDSVEIAVLDSFVMQSATNEQIRAEQLADPVLEAMIKFKEEDELPQDDKLSIYVARSAQWHSINDGVLFHIVKRKRPQEPDLPYEPTEQLVVPDHMKDALMASYHSGKLAGHLGHEKIFHTIARKYYWKNSYDDIRRHCNQCLKCAEFNKGPRRKARLYPTEVTEPFYRIFVDFEGELPETDRGNKYILVFTCSFTKFPICVPTKDCTARTAAEALITNVVLEHGCPVEVLSDQGPHFTAELFRRVCTALGIKKTFSTPYHSQTLGQVENMNKTLLSMLKKTLENEDNKWDLQLPYVVFAYRSAVHMSTKDSPFHAVYGRDPIHPHDLLVLPEIPADEDPYAREIQERVGRAWSSVREHLFVAKDKMAEYYNRNVVKDRVKVGDNVVKQIPVLKGRNRKFVPSFEAMYRVISMDPPNVVIQKWGEPITKRQEVHENLVKVYKGVWLEPPPHPASRRQARAKRAFLKKKFNCYKCYKRTAPGCAADTVSWVQCDYCRGWFHWQCVGMKRRPRKEHWFCPDCKEKGIIREGDPLDGYEPEEEREPDEEGSGTEETDPNQPGTSGYVPPKPQRVRRIRKRGGPIETDSELEEEQQPEEVDDGGESDSSATTIDA